VSTEADFTYDHYRRLLAAGLEAGYRFIGFDELAAARQADRYFCLLRHDCEGDLPAAGRLGEIEKELGIASTYFIQLRSPLYNPMSKPYGDVVRGLLELGHRIGLHFDERAHDHASPVEIADLVDAERKTLSVEFGVPVEVVSFHQPSRRVLDNQIRIRCLNTYDRDDMRDVGYLSDSRWQWREDPIEAFRAHRHPWLQLLLHPECWTDTSMPPEQKWHQVLRDNVDIAQETLLTREDTYSRRARITFNA
jgi:hypothetical protein